jgi:Spy/CpxP family protein refolding chaperone
MSTASRTIKAMPSVGLLLAALAVILVAAALLLAVAYVQPADSASTPAPAAAPAPVTHDRGWLVESLRSSSATRRSAAFDKAHAARRATPPSSNSGGSIRIRLQQ